MLKTLILTLLAVLALSGNCFAESFITETSWYSVDSCKAEKTWQKWGGRYANGTSAHNLDTDLVAASRTMHFGTRLRITCLATGKSVVCTVVDRGPSRKLYNKGRKLDLGKNAFGRIAPLDWGVTKVLVEVI